jgi:hypothetical protein
LARRLRRGSIAGARHLPPEPARRRRHAHALWLAHGVGNGQLDGDGFGDANVELVADGLFHGIAVGLADPVGLRHGDELELGHGHAHGGCHGIAHGVTHGRVNAHGHAHGQRHSHGLAHEHGHRVAL